MTSTIDHTGNGPGSWVRVGRALLHVGLLEWLVMVDLLVLFGMLILTPSERRPTAYLVMVLAVLAVMVAVTFAYRRFLEGRPWIRFLFRVLLIAGVVVPYTRFQEMIPIVSPRDLDAELRAMDLWLVGGDAAIWFEQFATPFTCAWFGVAYFGYYVAGGLFVLSMMIFCRRQLVFAEFAIVILGTICTALILYHVIPALGPYVYLADRFLGPLPEDVVVPFIHNLIQQGPLRDVFPSMHVGVPVAIFLLSARYYRWVAFLTGLWLPHIVISTMFLRYHYLVDIIAGIFLAATWFALARPAVLAYQRLRQRHGIRAEP